MSGDERVVPLDRVVRRVLEGVSGRDSRYIIGIAGPPGAGKSTLADALREAFGSAHGVRIAEIAPMDGYHLSNAELRVRGDLARKGEPDTFDAAGYVENLGRLRHAPIGEPVPWPTFDRRIEEPTPAGVVFTRQRVVITEGNYLLCDGAWSGVRDLLDERWYLDADRDVLERRLLRRHLRGGRTADAARAKVRDSDLRNADLIARTRSRADLVLRERQGGYHAVVR
ncbi:MULTISPECIES: nucleoside/nucleotide kinase family protein [Nocardia]|uniref:nucleoside/nucleotide kinase family protein n=1 Tax=Nocardia TaxID=1817 RepID=UPI001E40ABB7|nr:MULTISPECIES: nucleoside/nucleotide kinase family protein [Nocardia]